MSMWYDVPKEDIDVEDDEINVRLHGDDNGKNYAVLKVKDVIEKLMQSGDIK